MNSYFTKALVSAALVGVTTVASAAPMYLDGGAKSRGEYGWSGGTSSRAQPMYRSAAPAQDRSFSYEPAQPAQSSTIKADNNTSSNQPSQANATARTETRSTRSFSYEPGTTNSGSMRNRSTSQLPFYVLPKSDPRRYGGR